MTATNSASPSHEYVFKQTLVSIRDFKNLQTRKILSYHNTRLKQKILHPFQLSKPVHNATVLLPELCMGAITVAIN